MIDEFPQASFTAVDVDSSAIAYLQSQLSDVRLAATSFDPPLPFDAGEFDVVYSVSIWTHLTPEHQRLWLREIARVVRPGGLVLITTSSYSALRSRKRRGDLGWDSVTNEDLQRQGVIFLPYHAADRETWTPGIDSSYGLTLNDPARLKIDFGEVLQVRSVTVDAIDNVQDLVVLARP